MNLETIMFYLLSVLTVIASLRVITARNPVHAALFLVLAFFCMAGVWMLMQAEFLALTLVLVYVGAVMVLFLFVVMMLDINIEKLRIGFWRFLPFAAIVGIVLLVEMVMVLGSVGSGTQPVVQAAGYSNTKELGRLIYTNYVYVFELAAVLLVVAIVAAIALTLRQRHGSKHQEQSEQIQVRRQDRVRLVSMPSAKK